MSGSIYQVGVHLHAKDGVSGVLANISHSMLGLHGGVEKLQKGFSSLQVGLLGAAAVAAGYKIGHVVENLVEHGMAIEHWKSQLAAAGNSAVMIAKATDAAWATAGANMNTTAAENLKNIIEINKATGNLGDSIKLLPTFAIAENVLSSVKSEDIKSKFSAGSTQTLNFARGLEELGVTTKGNTPEERESNIRSYVGEYMKTMIASRGLFDGNALYGMTNNSALYSRSWDMNMATVVAPILGEVMKASKLGNADYMAIRSYQGGHITSESVEALVKHHLAKLGAENDPNADAYKDKHGFHLKPNNKFAAGMDENLWTWSNRVLEMLKKTGVNVNDPKAINALTNEIGSNKSTSMMMRMVLDPLIRQLMSKEIAQRDKVPNDAAGILQEQDPWMKLAALQKKFDDFLTALGGPLVDPAMKALDFMTSHVNQMAQYLAKNPDTAKAIATTLAGLAAGLTLVGGALVGGVLLAALGPAGWLVAGIVALGTAVAVMRPQELSEFVSGWKLAWDGLLKGNGTEMWAGIVKEWTGTVDMLPDALKNSIVKLDLEIQSWPGRLGAVISKMGADIIKAIGDAISGALGSLGGLLHHTSFGGGGFGGFINATYAGANDNGRMAMSGVGSWNGRVLGLGNSIGHSASPEERAAFIKAYSAHVGIDPSTGLRVAQSEGFYNYTGDHGTSYGDFQMHVGGGLGDILRKMGIDPTDPHQWKKADAFALDWASKHGWSDWHGAARVGISKWQGIGMPPRRAPVIVVHHHTHLDGKIIAQSTTRHQADEGLFPTAVGGVDTHGSFASPGTPLLDVA